MTDAPILVTGAGGFVCSEIALALVRAGRAVVAMDQHFDTATTARLGHIQRIEGNLIESIASARGPYSAVIHGAAITASPERLGISRAAHIRRNMDLLTAALDHARALGASRFLFISSMGVFEPNDAPAPNGRFTEATAPTAACPYCAAKQAGELLTTSASEAGFTTLSLRLGNIFGPHEAVRETRQNLCLVSRMIAEARTSGVITVQTPEALREWAWLPDLADAIADLVLRDAWSGPSVLHAGTPPVIGDLAVARAIAERIPGTTIRLAPPSHPAIRPPMASQYDVFDTVQWTGMPEALGLMIPMEAAQ